MNYEDYAALKRKIVPGLQFNQSIYEEMVSESVSAQTVWLDAGCGRRILPLWREEAETALVRKVHLAVGCDIDTEAMRKHRTLGGLVAANLERLPFKNESLSLITCNMVVEHLDRPHVVFTEFARVLKDGGRVVVHTPNIYSYFVLGSRFVPRRLKLKLAQALDSRVPDEVFPTLYRANTVKKLRAMMAQVGLREERCRMLASEAVFATTHPLLAAVELLYIRLTLRSTFKSLRVSILASFRKSGISLEGRLLHPAQ